MGNCCGAAPDVSEADSLEAPPRGRHNVPLSDEHSTQADENNNKDNMQSASAEDKSRKQIQQDKQEYFTALDMPDSRDERSSEASGKSGITANTTNACIPPCATTAALSHPGGCGGSVVTTVTTSTVNTGNILPDTSPINPVQGLQNGSSANSIHNVNMNSWEYGGGGGADALLSDVFHISESSLSSSSSSSSLADHDALSTSLVEVSQATQSIRHHDRTHSEFDATSEWAETSMDRTVGRRGSQSRLVDRNRLQHLLISEAEGRASLTHMYLAQHRRALIRCVKEQFIEQRAMMLRDHQAEHTASCAMWLQTRERTTREMIAREWWTERAALAWRTSVTSTPPTATMTATVCLFTDPLTDGSEHGKRDDSLVHMGSHTGREGELTSSEGTVEEDSAGMRSPSLWSMTSGAIAGTTAANVHKAFSAPCAGRLALTDPTPVQLLHPHGAVRKVPLAHQALRDRIPRGRQPSLQTSESL